MSDSDTSYQPDKESKTDTPGDPTMFREAVQHVITNDRPVTNTRKTNNSKAVQLDAEQGDIDLV